MIKKYTFVLWFLAMLSGYAQVWKTDSEVKNIYFQEPLPVQYHIYSTSRQDIVSAVWTAPFADETVVSNHFFSCPADLSGRIEKFNLFRTKYMEDGLAAKYSGIRTFRGKSKSGKVLYITITPQRINLVVMRPGKPTFLLKPYAENAWIGFPIDKQPIKDFDFECDTEAEAGNDAPRFYTTSRPAFDDQTLRQYRYAISTTGEFSQYTLNRLGISSSASDADKKAAIVGALVTAVARINSIYERDLAITLQLVNNEDQVIFLDASSDPFDNGTTQMQSLIQANQTTVDSHIGSSNYDVSQVWCQGGLQGLAMLAAVCGSLKGSSAARGQHPETDRFIVSVASHELGHLFGANHVFSNSTCGGNRHDNTAVETGSGTTIMAYAGICPPDIQNWTDDRFNEASIKEIKSYVFTGNGGTCSVNTSLSNNPPSVVDIPDRYMPKGTPFVLPARGSDPDGDTLTFTWDEQDAPSSSHNISTPPQSTWTDGPMFRPYPPTTDTLRYFPTLDSIRANILSTEWEVLPTVTRLLTFDITARDNHPGGGQTKTQRVYLGIEGNIGPFEVTSQQTAETWAPGDSKTITWNVAGTDGGNVNCSNVDIILSRDGGLTFTDTLAANVPNNGQAVITVPNLDSPAARFIVKARDNYFFSMNKGTITIGNFQTTCGHTFSNAPTLTIPDNNTQGIYDTIHVTDNEYINDLNVHVDISHNYVRDLTVELITPQGQTVTLWQNNCGNQHNLNLTFDSEGDPLDCSNLTGNRQPVNSLAIVNSQYAAGDWVLHVYDNASPDAGVLNSWSLDFCFVTQSVKENTLPSVDIYPNPARERIHVRFPSVGTEEVRITLYDMSGRMIWYKNYRGETGIFSKDVNLTNFARGNYLMEIRQGQKFHREIIQVY